MRRKKLRGREILMHHYIHVDASPSPATKRSLAEKTGLSIRQVNDWFGNAKRRHPVAFAGSTVQRYPGGTPSDYWRWKDGWIDSNWAQKYPYRGGATPRKWASFARSGGSNVSTVIVLCQLSAFCTVEDQISHLEAHEAAGTPVKYVELGNEMYDGSRADVVEKYPNGSVYAAAMVPFLRAVRERFPNARVALIGERWNDYHNEREDTWNDQVLNNGSGALADAATLHIYCGWDADAADPSEANVASHLAVAATRAFNNGAYSHQTIPDHLRVWVTEMGVYPSGALDGTWLEALFYAAMVMQLPAAMRRLDVLTTYCALCGDPTASSFTTAAFGPVIPPNASGTVPIVPTLKGSAQAQIFRALAGGEEMARLNFTNNSPLTVSEPRSRTLLGWWIPSLRRAVILHQGRAPYGPVFLGVSSTALVVDCVFSDRTTDRTLVSDSLNRTRRRVETTNGFFVPVVHALAMEDLRWVKLTPSMRPEHREDLAKSQQSLLKRERSGVKKVLDIVPAALCMEFGPKSEFIAVGHEDGYVNVWDLRTVCDVVRQLSPYEYPRGTTTTTKDRPPRGSVRGLKWIGDMQVAVLHESGDLAVWDLHAEAFVGPAYAYSFPKNTKIACARFAATSPHFGFFATTTKTTTAGGDGRGRRSFTTTTTPDISRVDMKHATLETVDDAFEGSDETVIAILSVSRVRGESRDAALVVVCASSLLVYVCPRSLKVILRKRMRKDDQILTNAQISDDGRKLTTCLRSGSICVHDISEEKGCDHPQHFSDVVENVKFSEAHARGDTILGVSSKLFHQNGARSIFLWNRHVSGAVRTLASPSSLGVRTLACFPTAGGLCRNALALALMRARTAVSSSSSESDGALYMLVPPPPKQTWFGPFFSPRFVLLTENEEYAESETEFDRNEEEEEEEEEVVVPASKRRSVVDHFLVDGRLRPADVSRARRYVSVDTLFHRDFLNDGGGRGDGATNEEKAAAAVFPGLWED
eukprot:g252.t1